VAFKMAAVRPYIYKIISNINALNSTIKDIG
jgi:hypothetical protein